jgi:hypothetical protein
MSVTIIGEFILFYIGLRRKYGNTFVQTTFHTTRFTIKVTVVLVVNLVLNLHPVVKGVGGNRTRSWYLNV